MLVLMQTTTWVNHARKNHATIKNQPITTRLETRMPSRLGRAAWALLRRAVLFVTLGGFGGLRPAFQALAQAALFLRAALFLGFV